MDSLYVVLGVRRDHGLQDKVLGRQPFLGSRGQHDQLTPEPRCLFIARSRKRGSEKALPLSTTSSHPFHIVLKHPTSLPHHKISPHSLPQVLTLAVSKMESWN